MQALQLIIFAVLAAVVLWQLYAVLGRRVGRQPEDNAKAAAETASRDPRLKPEPVDATAPEGVADLRARDPDFDPHGFLHGARGAYEMIVLAFAAGDRERLENLLAPDVYQSFDAAIGQREAENRTEKVEFLHPPRADLEDVTVAGDVARARVRFLAEFRSRTTGPAGEAVDDRRTAEVWTFERPVDSPDPNWRLTRVESADA